MSRYLIFVVASVALVLGVSNCSFVFDFSECEADEDCQQFDEPDEGRFFVCTDEERCVLEPQRECREDKHCSDGAECEEGSCTSD